MDVVHRYKDSQSVIPEDEETFFYEGVLKWKDLNCTKDFDNFLADLGPEIQTLAQIVHRQKAIVETLQEHLQKEKSLALQPLLEYETHLLMPKLFSPHWKSYIID